MLFSANIEINIAVHDLYYNYSWLEYSNIDTLLHRKSFQSQTEMLQAAKAR